MSPSLEENPDYTDEYLDRYLDTIQAQLLYMGSVGVIPKAAMEALRDSGLTIYIDDPHNQREWWPCEPGPGGCYSSDTHRIGGSFWGNAGNVMNGWHWQSFILHEAAHAYHSEIIVEGFGNRCILEAYQRNRHRYELVDNSARASGIPPHEEVQRVEHWAYRTAMEYFAELSEAYFFRGTSYPWNRVELYRHDEDGYHMVREAWNDPAFCDSDLPAFSWTRLAREQRERDKREAEQREVAWWQAAEEEVAHMVQGSCAVSRAGVGGNEGTLFPPAEPLHLSMRAGHWIDALILNGRQHGGNGGRNGEVLQLQPGEYINRAAIGAGAYVDRLEFHTNFGRSISGGLGNSASRRDQLHLDNIRLLFIGGRSGQYLNRIEVMYCSGYHPEKRPPGRSADLELMMCKIELAACHSLFEQRFTCPAPPTYPEIELCRESLAWTYPDTLSVKRVGSRAFGRWPRPRRGQPC